MNRIYRHISEGIKTPHLLVSFGFGYVVGILVVERYFFHTSWGQDWVGVLLGLLGVGSLVPAVLAYIENKKREIINDTLDIARHFRDILRNAQPIINKILLVDVKHKELIRVEIKQGDTFHSISKNDSGEFHNQSKTWSDNQEVLDGALLILNDIESIALEILLKKVQNHKAMRVVHLALIELVESFSGLLLFHRDVKYENASMFSNTLELYWYWKAHPPI